MKVDAYSRQRTLKNTGTLGTFAGVFTPSVLTILGIILFLRLGFMVGSAGLARALTMIALANVISVLTSVSLSAVATNLRVKGGGDYYLISRTLGVAFGGAIGLILFLAQAVSIAFYTIGFGEAVAAMLPAGVPAAGPRTVAVAAVAFLFVFAWLGADWATKFQYVVMALLAAALFSFFAGGLPVWRADQLIVNWAGPQGAPGFWVLFAIFFPAVTGFTQGVSMSGDLKDPGRSLPLGTFLAVGVSIVVYFGGAVVFAGVFPNAVLSGDYGAMKRVARWALLIDAGVIAATLSSAMASFLGAPRILQSLAGDRIFPFLNPFARGTGPGDNPRRGVLLAGAIALATIALGNLNVIAPVVSMFFLISYGLLNYATYYEARTESPAFRPRFKWFHRHLSLAGFLACLGVMLAIDLKTGLVALSIIFGIFQYLKRTAGPARWADSHRAYHLQRVRENLLAASVDPEHPRDWRPMILAFSNDPQRRSRLLLMASWMEGRSGMTTIVTLVQGTGLKVLKQREAAEAELRRDLAERQSTAFPLVVATADFQSGIHTLLQAAGIGPLRINTILLNWLNPESRVSEGFREFLFGRQLRTVYRLGCSIAVLHTDAVRWQELMARTAKTHRIDLWWQDDASSRLMLLLAYLITRSEPWLDARIRVIATAEAAGGQTPYDRMQQMFDDVRIEAEPIIVPDSEAETVAGLCSDASMVLLPFRLAGNLIVGPSPGRVEELLFELPTALLVLAAEDIDLDAEPEEGAAGETAAVLDAMADAEKRARQADKDAQAAREALSEAREKLRVLQDAGTDRGVDMDPDAPIAALAELEAAAKTADRRAAKARAKVETMAEEARQRGMVPDKEKKG